MLLPNGSALDVPALPRVHLLAVLAIANLSSLTVTCGPEAMERLLTSARKVALATEEISAKQIRKTIATRVTRYFLGTSKRSTGGAFVGMGELDFDDMSANQPCIAEIIPQRVRDRRRVHAQIQEKPPLRIP